MPRFVVFNPCIRPRNSFIACDMHFFVVLRNLELVLFVEHALEFVGWLLSQKTAHLVRALSEVTG